MFSYRDLGGVDIALVMTRPLPTQDASDWPCPTVSEWRAWLAEQPTHDRSGNPVPGTVLADKPRRNIEALVSQIFNFALRYDPLPLLGRNPCTPLGLTVPEAVECVWLERSAAELLLACLDPHFVVLVQFLLGTGVRWGEAAALQVEDLRLDEPQPWLFVHKTWKRLGRRDASALGRAKHVWGRGRTKTATGRRRISLTRAMADLLRPLVDARDPEAPVFTMKGGGVLHNGNFTTRYLLPALARARALLAERRAAAGPSQLAGLPAEIPEVRPHAFRHSHAAWLLSSGRSELEVQRRLGHVGRRRGLRRRPASGPSRA